MEPQDQSRLTATLDAGAMLCPKGAARQAREVRRVTLWGLAANLGLTLVKFVAGTMAGSQALVADAVHSVSDMSTDLAVLIGVRYWSEPADADHPYGHGRIETLVSLFIGVVLAGVGVGLAWRALTTLPEYHEVVPGWLALAAACLSVLCKEGLYRWTARVGKRVRSAAVMANAWHHRSDALSSLPVAVAVLGTHLRPSWGFLDHVAAVIVSVLILQAAWGIAWPALRQLIDAGAAKDQRETILALAAETEGVREVHGLRTRHMGTGLQADLHVLVAPDLTVHEGHEIAGAVTARLLARGPGVVDVLVHVEPYEGPDAGPRNEEPRRPERAVGSEA